MKLVFKLSLILFALFTFGDESFSLTNYQIKKFCNKQKRVLTCKKILEDKRSKLEKGIPIEIPVIPYQR